MGDNTGIEWTDATWNPVSGCSAVSPGCDHCYAETIANRFAGTKAWPNGFQVTLRPERLDQPIRWKRPRRIFVNSTSDLFHDLIPDDYIAQVWAVMARCQHHTFQILTKRHGRMRSLLEDPVSMFYRRIYDHLVSMDYEWIDTHPLTWPLPNVWLGCSVENQKWADIRVPALLETPASVRFVSAEPMLGPVDLWHSHCPSHDFNGGFCTFSCPERRQVDWVICGGESGTGARRMDPEWARGLRDRCAESGMAFHFKQAGSVLAKEWGCSSKGGNADEWPELFPREYPVR